MFSRIFNKDLSSRGLFWCGDSSNHTPALAVWKENALLSSVSKLKKQKLIIGIADSTDNSSVDAATKWAHDQGALVEDLIQGDSLFLRVIERLSNVSPNESSLLIAAYGRSCFIAFKKNSQITFSHIAKSDQLRGRLTEIEKTIKHVMRSSRLGNSEILLISETGDVSEQIRALVKKVTGKDPFQPYPDLDPEIVLAGCLADIAVPKATASFHPIALAASLMIFCSIFGTQHFLESHLSEKNLEEQAVAAQSAQLLSKAVILENSLAEYSGLDVPRPPITAANRQSPTSWISLFHFLSKTTPKDVAIQNISASLADDESDFQPYQGLLSSSQTSNKSEASHPEGYSIKGQARTLAAITKFVVDTEKTDWNVKQLDYMREGVEDDLSAYGSNPVQADSLKGTYSFSLSLVHSSSKKDIQL